ncbi:MAG: MBL fold metallo-hydrolase [Hyphomicrobiaceae bacterium]|nr:MBL fold metallo-hydrolase [Hyphomicrobiaceae bacterium]
MPDTVRPILLSRLFGRRSANRYYSGPVSDHFDGVRFFNPGVDTDRSFAELLRWSFGDKGTPWPKAWPGLEADRPPARVEGADIRVSFIGHASFLVQTAGLNLLIDPVYAERASPVGFAGPKRVNPPAIAFADLPRIDWLLISHNHYDHMDLGFIRQLWRRDRPRLATPLGNDTIIRRAVPEIVATVGDWGDRLALGGGVDLFLEPTQHWSARGMGDRRHALWAAMVIATPGGKVYFAGDTGFGGGWAARIIRERHPDLRLGLIPIGAYEPRWFMHPQHVNPEEAVALYEILRPREALGYHWGTFRLTNEPIDEPMTGLAQALAARDIAPERFVAARPGLVWRAAEA